MILARELTIDQIAAIRKETSVELECFVHGALCVGASGQCYMSYALGGRSGNRGACAQPCRRLYTLKDAAGNVIVKDRYLLSLKDLNLSAHLEDLLNAGVTSLKIEGRLKDAGYVANIVGFYRQKLDAILQQCGLRKSSSGTVSLNFTPEPAKVVQSRLFRVRRNETTRKNGLDRYAQVDGRGGRSDLRGRQRLVYTGR